MSLCTTVVSTRSFAFSRPYRTKLGRRSPDLQAGQFSRTQGLRRKLSEPSSAGQSPAASLCSQRTTSDDDSNLAFFISFVCPIPHVRVNKNLQQNTRTNRHSSVLICISRQKLARRTHDHVGGWKAADGEDHRRAPKTCNWGTITQRLI